MMTNSTPAKLCALAVLLVPCACWLALTRVQGQPRAQAQLLSPWRTGMQWQVQSQTYQMQAMGEPTWLPPVQWTYQLTGRQNIGQVPCHVVAVTQQDQARPVMRLYVGTRDLNLVQVDTEVTVAGEQQWVSQQFGQGQLQTLYQLGPAPSQLPQQQTQLPPPYTPGQKAMPIKKSFKAVASAGPGLTFETEVDQTIQAISGAQLKAILPPEAAGIRAGGPGQKLYRITLEAPGTKTMQVVGTTSPWPLYSETPTQKSWLVGFTTH